MFANMFSCKSDNRFALEFDKESGRVKSDEFPEVDFKLKSEFGTVEDKIDLMERFPDEFYSDITDVEFIRDKNAKHALDKDVSVRLRNVPVVKFEDSHSDFEYGVPGGNKIVVESDYILTTQEDLDYMSKRHMENYLRFGDERYYEASKKYDNMEPSVVETLDEVDDRFAYFMGTHIDTDKVDDEVYVTIAEKKSGKDIVHMMPTSRIDSFASVVADEYGFGRLVPDILVYPADIDFDVSIPKYRNITFEEAEEYADV